MSLSRDHPRKSKQDWTGRGGGRTDQKELEQLKWELMQSKKRYMEKFYEIYGHKP
jgi:hypothetical protein